MNLPLPASLALALLLAPHFALAQTRVTITTPPNSAPIVIDGKPVTLPDPRQLLDHLFDPYDGSKAFTATFDVSLQDGKPQPSPALKAHLKAMVRPDLKGVDGGAKVVGTIEKEGHTYAVQFLDDGRDTDITFGDKEGHGDVLDLFTEQILPLGGLFDNLEKSTQVADFSPTALDVLLGETPLLALDAKDKNGHELHAVVDAQTHALVSLEVPGVYSVRVSDQTFDAPIADSEFEATQVADFRHANPHSATLIVPSILSGDDDDDGETATKAPATSTPAK